MARTLVRASSQFLEVVSAPVAAMPLTMACWFKPVDTTISSQMSYEPAAAGQYYRLYTGTQVNAAAYDGSAIGTASVGAITTGAWTHCAAVFTGTASRAAFQNGTKSTIETTTVNGITFARVELGRVYFNGSPLQYANGDIAEAAIWNVALSDADIAALALGLSPLLVRPDALVFYAPLMGQNSPELDVVGRRDLAVTGATAATHPRVYLPTGRQAFTSKSIAAAFAASSSFGVSTTAALAAGSRLAASSSFAFASSAVFNAAAFTASSTIGVSSSATLTAPVRFAAASSFSFATTALFASVRFNATTGLRLSTSATLTTGTEAVHASRVAITLAGADVRVRVSGLSIRDVLNDSPNTCALTIDGSEAPTIAQALRISINLDAPRVLFNGALQTVDVSFEGLPEQKVYPATGIDDTPRANRRRPFGAWTNVSATTVVQYLVAVFAPGFTAVNVEAGLPTVSVIFDGSEGMNGALTQIANLIGGYFYWDLSDLHFFREEASDAPDAIDDTPGRFLNDPPITMSRDSSQLRTRQFGKGHGEALLADVGIGETIVPVSNAAAWFNAIGGHAIAGSQILAYAGVKVGGGGGLIGPGAAPSNAPVATLVAAAGVDSGAHDYAVSFVTALGESLPGPHATVTTGTQSATAAAPSTAPTPGTPTAGGAVDVGTHSYATTFVTAVGETTIGPSSFNVTTNSGLNNVSFNPTYVAGGSLPAGTVCIWFVTLLTASGETAIQGGIGNTIVAGLQTANFAVPISADPRVTGRKVYRRDGAGSPKLIMTIAQNTSIVSTGDAGIAGGAVGPIVDTSNTAERTIPVTAIPLGPVGTTGRKVYRTAAGGSTLGLLATIADNTTTSLSDAAADSTLGAAPPATNTTTVTTAFNQVGFTGIPIGAVSVTSRKIYRTAVGSTQLKLQQTIANNTATTGITDATADASLGANAPTVDASGLKQPEGQINVGSTSLIVAGTGAFDAAGGWAIIGNGTQAVRYTGVTGAALTGVPASGIGAVLATVSWNSTVTAAPALTGVTGLGLAVVGGTPINIWVQRDDLGAQAEQAAIDAANGITPADGIYEAAPITDERRGEASMIALCDANLARYSRPLVTVRYATRDLKTKSGKPVVIDIASPPIHETLTIQEVTIDEIDTAPGVLPRFTVVASSDMQSLDGLLRQLLAATQ